ncbi:MAG: SDR family oxidoreductase [Halomonadaceae bacterium]|nr:MAG: SDR family oxidoreductase [Halomonadaceae bacterium]
MRLLITGAANGIGACIAQQAVTMGHSVIAADLDGAALEAQWADSPEVHCERLDVRSEQQWHALFDRLDSTQQVVDVLVNVAGVLRSGQTGELNGDNVRLMLEVNVQGVIFGANAAAAHMIRHGRKGHIINIGSVASLFATPGNTIYAASKFAVRGFSIAAAGDLRPHGIAVTLVGPGPVKTGMLEQQRGDDDAALTFAGGRALTPDEVARCVLGPVLKQRPLEIYLPRMDGIIGKIANAAPGLFLRVTRYAAARGRKHFQSDNFR